MKRPLLATLAIATLALALPPTAAAQASATVSLMHGIPGATVDVIVDGAVVIGGFEPGTMQDLSAFAGQTLRNVEVRAAGTDDVVIGPIAELAVPASGNWTVLAHLTADGTPTITPFENDVAAVPAGQARLTVRHAAAAPAVDVVLADGARPFTNLSNPNQASAVLPAGVIAGAQIAPAGGAPIAPVPTVELAAGTNLVVYAVGSLEGGSFTFYTQTITGLGGEILVNTGNSLPDGQTSLAPLLALAAGALAVLGTGILATARARR
jgi:hypothetical protein